MYKSLLLLVVLSCSFYYSVAHSVLTAINVDGKQYGQFECARPHPSSQWDYPISQKNRPTGLTSADMTCGWLPSAAKAASKKCPVQPGSTIGLQWHYELNTNNDNYIIAPDHKGPCIVYMAKSETGSGNVWFKVFEDGYDATSKTFCVDRLIKNKGYMTFKLPTDITPGNYLLRGELIALHEGFQLNGAQPYVGCFEITMGGSGTVNPGSNYLVAIPGVYKNTDAGINFNIYQGFKSYPIPGPTVYKSGSSNSNSPAPTPSTPSTPTTPTPTTPSPTSPTNNGTTVNVGNMCYQSGTAYIEANLGKGGRCGSKAKTRCPDGQCCSQYGYCGKTTEYCTKNQGDYRTVSCSSISGGIPANQYYATSPEDDVELEASNSAFSVGVSFVVMAVAYAFA